MLFVISAKQFLKYSKKLVMEKDYVILDCTDEEISSDLTKLTGVVTVDDFAVPSKLLRVISTDSEDILDIDSIEELEKEFFRGIKFKNAVLATMSTFITSSSDINIFIVIRNKAYKYYRKRIESEFCRVFSEAASLIHIFEGDVKKMKSLLKKDITEKEREILLKELKKKEKEAEEWATKKKKKAKKKKKKSDGWGYVNPLKM